MAYAIESNQHSMVDRFGNFTHLVSGGNVQLPSEILRLDLRINLIDRPASGPLGAIQLSGGQGNFINDSDFEVSIDITNGESSLTIGQTNISKAYLLLNPYTGPGFSPNDGAIKCLEAGGIQSIQAYINGSWTPMTGTGGSVPGGANTEVQFNGLGNFAGDANFTWVTGSGTLSVPNLLARTSLQLEDPGVGTDVITIQAPTSLTAYSLTLPVDDGFSSQFLQTDGLGVLTWATAVTTPAGANTEVQYNNGGNFAASSDFTWVVGTGILSVPNLLATTSLQLEETGGGVDVITIQAPASLSAYSLTLPVDDGISGEFLQTDGSGVLTWATTAAQVAGANTQIQYNDSGVFGANSDFTWVNTTKTLNLGNSSIANSTSADAFLFDALAKTLKVGTLRFGNKYDLELLISDQTLQILGEPDLSGPPTGLSQIVSGYSLFTQVTSNQTKGNTALWGPVVPTFLQTYHYSGHDYDRYSSLDPYEDSILHTKSFNVGQPIQTMDLGMSSRIHTSQRGSMGGYGYGSAPGGSWEQVPGDDNDFIVDPYAEVSMGGYPNWVGQVQYKTSVPGIYVQERRWDWVVARQNHTTSLQLRSSDRPSFNPIGGPVEGIDFYDLKIGSFDQGTFTNNPPGGTITEYYQHSTLGLTLSKNLAASLRGTLSDDIVKISTNRIPNIAAPLNGGVNFSTSSQTNWGGGWLNFTTYDTVTGGSLSSNIVVDGFGGEIKSLSKIESGILGGTGVGVTSTLTSSLNQGVLTISSDNVAPVTLFQAEGNSLGTELKVNDTSGTTLVNINSLIGASPNAFKYYNQTSGLAYISNTFAVTNGVNSDNVGVMSLTSVHTTVRGVDILQLNSDFVLTGYPPAGTYGTNLINCKNSTSTVTDNSLFRVDVAGKVSQQTDQDIDGATFGNTRTGSGGLFTNSVLVAQSQYLSPLAPFDFTGVNQGGFSFMKCNLPNVSGGVWPTRCQIDGDGSIKNMVSLTVSDANSTWPPTGNSSNITLVPGVQSTITTRYSSFITGGLPRPGNPLRLQAAGDPELGSPAFAYGNMVEIIPNNGFRTTQLKFNNSNPISGTENILWWTDISDPDDDESLYMVTRPAGSLSGGFTSTRAIFEFKAGGSLPGAVAPNIFRYYPEGRDSTSGIVNRFILGDDIPAGVIQMGGGKVGTAGGTAATQGKISVNVVDCDAIDTFSISGGTAASSLAIGVTLTDEVNIQLGGNANTGSGSIHLGTSGYIRCTAAGTPATGSTGPTNIVNANHKGYIGTGSLIAVNQTGLRGSTVITQTAASTVKIYVAPNLAIAADGAYVTASCIEGPQGTIFLRGQVKLTGVAATIDLDAAIATVGTMIMPHNFPLTGWVAGTFGSMFQNPQVTVSNAGTIVGGPPVPPDINMYAIDPLFTPVQGIITLTGAPGAQVAHLIIQSQGLTADIVVNYIVCAERKDTSYVDTLTNSFVQHYNNTMTGTTKTWNGGALPVQLDAQFGAGSWQ